MRCHNCSRLAGTLSWGKATLVLLLSVLAYFKLKQCWHNIIMTMTVVSSLCCRISLIVPTAWDPVTLFTVITARPGPDYCLHSVCVANKWSALQLQQIGLMLCWSWELNMVNTVLCTCLDVTSSKQESEIRSALDMALVASSRNWLIVAVRRSAQQCLQDNVGKLHLHTQWLHWLSDMWAAAAAEVPASVR